MAGKVYDTTTSALSEVVERALVAFSQDPNYFVSIVDQGRVNADRYEIVLSATEVTRA